MICACADKSSSQGFRNNFIFVGIPVKHIYLDWLRRKLLFDSKTINIGGVLAEKTNIHGNIFAPTSVNVLAGSDIYFKGLKNPRFSMGHNNVNDAPTYKHPRPVNWCDKTMMIQTCDLIQKINTQGNTKSIVLWPGKGRCQEGAWNPRFCMGH